ncbi:MAG: Crp/Fnr family transcriptional regulator [Bacteroidota bacterium]
MAKSLDTDYYFTIFFDYVRQLVDIPEVDQEICRQYFQPTFVKKDTLLAEAGTVHEHHNFIVSGFMRNYHHNQDSEEVTTDINDGPRFFTSYNHFMNRTVSNENLHCITDCELLRVKRDDVDIMAKIGITQMDYSLQILQQHLEKNRQRMIDLTTLSAEERYLKLMRDHPTILQHVPLKYIASYLGINPGSLSRIRKGLV